MKTAQTAANGKNGESDGTLETWLPHLHPDDRKHAGDEIRRALVTHALMLEFRVVWPDQSIHWLHARGKAEVDAAGNPHRVVGIHMDITERKLAEIDARRNRQQLTHLARVAVLGELSGALAHELNQPLTAILSSAQAAQNYLAMSPDVAPVVNELLESIVQQDKRAGEIISHLRVMIKKGDPQFQPLDLNVVITGMIRLVKSDLIARNVAVVLDLSPGVPLIRGDAVQLQQLLLNLILNGAEAMSGNPPSGRILTMRTCAAGNRAEVSISDCGTGFPEEKIASIFEPFTTTKKQGLGLGLSICRTIAATHNGELNAANNPEKGAIFTLRLPALNEGESS